MRYGLAVLIAGGLLCADSFMPADVKIAGDVEYGHTTPPIEYKGEPQYSAVLFNGNSGDRIDITVKDGDRTAFVALADGGLNQIASGKTHLTATLPNAGPDLGTYYIVFRDSERKPATFTVELKQLNKAAAQKGAN